MKIIRLFQELNVAIHGNHLTISRTWDIFDHVAGNISYLNKLGLVFF